MTSRITPELLAQLRAWEGRSETRDEVLHPAPLHGMAATLECWGLPARSP
jgi:hypothetical protein